MMRLMLCTNLSCPSPRNVLVEVDELGQGLCAICLRQMTLIPNISQDHHAFYTCTCGSTHGDTHGANCDGIERCIYCGYVRGNGHNIVCGRISFIHQSGIPKEPEPVRFKTVSTEQFDKAVGIVQKEIERPAKRWSVDGIFAG